MNDIQLNYNKADISIKKISSVFHKIRPANFSFKQTQSNSYRLALILSGSAVYDFGKKRTTVNKNDLIFLKKNETYSVTVNETEPWEHIVITFEVWNDKEIDALPFKFLQKTSHSKQFEEIFKNILNVYNMGGVSYNIEMKSLAYRIISLLLEENEKQFFKKSKYKGIKKAVEFIETNYKEKITVDELAIISGYSISHFSRLFKELYSVAPIEYINNLRINRAKSMLKTDMFTLSEIAEECGFANVYYFSRIFKQTVGVTPRKY